MLIIWCGRWDKSFTEAATKAEDEKTRSSTKNGMNLKLVPVEERQILRKRAQDLLSGRTKWTPGWTDFQRDGRPLAGM